MTLGRVGRSEPRKHLVGHQSVIAGFSVVRMMNGRLFWVKNFQQQRDVLRMLPLVRNFPLRVAANFLELSWRLYRIDVALHSCLIHLRGLGHPREPLTRCKTKSRNEKGRLKRHIVGLPTRGTSRGTLRGALGISSSGTVRGALRAPRLASQIRHWPGQTCTSCSGALSKTYWRVLPGIFLWDFSWA